MDSTIHDLPACETCRSDLELRGLVPLYENFLPTLFFGILHKPSCSDRILSVCPLALAWSPF